MGEQSLKNIARPIRVFAVNIGMPASHPPAPTPSVDPVTSAVFPLNFSIPSPRLWCFIRKMEHSSGPKSASRDYLGMPAAQVCLSRGLLASGAAARGNPNGNLGTAGPFSRWDHEFESGFLHRRVSCEPVSAGARHFRASLNDKTTPGIRRDVRRR
jgi:hypothetical protein